MRVGVRLFPRVAVGTLFCSLFGATAAAGSLLDYIRSYDLNDYALGVALTVSESPYADAGSSTYAYPYLTSFTHSAFTNDWLLIRDGTIGARYVAPANWEVGIVGRIQTLGPGAPASANLQAGKRPHWGTEVAPLLGWRGWPVHFQFRTYWDVPNRHAGTNSQLEASLPVSLDRGFFVPTVRLERMSSAYAAHYFGTAENPGIPAYDPGSATNLRLSFALGYELTPTWLLSLSAGVDFLDDRIADSPIVDKDRTWSVLVGASYNADIFQPREHAATIGRRPLELRASFLGSRLVTDARHDAVDGPAGDDVSFEDFLGVSDRETLLQLDVRYRLAFYHRLDLGYSENDRRTESTLQRDFDFGDETFPAGTAVTSFFDARRFRLAYGYSLMRDDQKELGVSFGLTHTRFEVEISAPETGQRERVDIDTPLPTMGVFGALALGRQWQLSAEIDLFALDFDRYSGYSGRAVINLDRRFGDRVSAGIGYNYYATRLEGETEDLRGVFRTRNYGPTASVVWSF